MAKRQTPKQTSKLSPQRRDILDYLGDDYDTVVFFEPAGMDVAIIGLSCRQPSRPPCVVYDYAKLLKYFQAEGMTIEDAVEWMGYNTLGAWVGDATPIVLETVLNLAG